MSIKIHKKNNFDTFEGPREACGVFGIYSSKPTAARVTFFGLFALQHRGQESAGIVSSDGDNVYIKKGMGLVTQIFSEDRIQALAGNLAVGHTRYSTFGFSNVSNAQPFIVETIFGRIAIAHNGELTNGNYLRKELMTKGVGMFKNSDSEVIAQLLSHSVEGEDKKPDWEGRIKQFMSKTDGAYSLVLLTKDAVYGVRDVHGLRPLCYGELADKSGFCIASESCALRTIDATYVREVNPGEILKLDISGVTSFLGRAPAKPAARCSFEYVYFSRPDSLMEGQWIHSVRQRLGRQLAIEAPCSLGSIVVGVPDSSLPAAIGYSQQSGLPYQEGLCKNRYIGRTFIQPADDLRKKGIVLKYNVLEDNLKGKDIVLIDDSIVRGNTLNSLVGLLKAGGAKSVHVRICSPPVRHPCLMGVDMSTYEELIAYSKTIEEIRVYIKADSLAYLSHDGMMKAINEGLKDDEYKGHCSACFTGHYPLKIDW